MGLEEKHGALMISPVCPTYVAQPETYWVMNQFGEFYPATTNIDMMDVYRHLAERST